MTRRKTTAPTPILEEELREGEVFTQMGDLHEALMRAARALSVAPDSDAAMDFADRTIGATSDALDALKLTPDVPYGIVALRARAMATRSRFVEAIHLALQVAAFRPSLPYVEWTLPWSVSCTPTAAETDVILAEIGRLAAALKRQSLDAGALRNAQAAGKLLETLPHGAGDERFDFLRTTFLRLCGEYDRAIELARSAFSRKPSWLSAVALANALRDAGKVDEAVEAFESATRLDPRDTTALIELAKLHLQASHRKQAIAALERALSIAPTDEQIVALLREIT